MVNQDSEIVLLRQELDKLKGLVNEHLGFRQSLPTSNIPHQEQGLFFGAQQFLDTIGSPDIAFRGSSGAGVIGLHGWALDAANFESVGITFASTLSSLSFTAYFACPNGNAGDIVTIYYIATIKEGEQVDKGVLSYEPITTTVPGVTDQIFAVRFTPIDLPLADQLVRFVVGRLGSDVADTYASDVWFLGAKIF